MTQPPAKEVGHSAPDGARRRVLAWFTPDRRFRLGVAASLSAVYVGVILYYTHGGLLYSADNVGIYSWQDLALRPYANNVIPAAVDAAAPSNPSVGFYATLFFGALFATYACQLFARALLLDRLSERSLRLAQTLASGLFLIGPAAIVTSYTTLTSNVSVSNGADFLVFAGFVGLLRGVDSGRGFPRRAALLLGVAVGLSATPFPNDVRILGLELLGFSIGAALLVPLLTTASQRGAFRASLARLGLYAIPTALALQAYNVYTLVAQWIPRARLVGAAAAAQVSPAAASDFSTLPDSLRLLGKFGFAGPGVPYHALFFSNPPIVLASFLWPVLALMVPLLFVRARSRTWILGAEVLALLCVTWETSPNPPAGVLDSAVVGRLPYGSQLIPPYFLSAFVLAKLYPVLIAFSLTMIYVRTRRWLEPAHEAEMPVEEESRPSASGAGARVRKHRRTPAVLSALAAGGLALLVSLVGLPIFDGTAEELWFNPGQKGFFVPSEYYTTRTVLTDQGGNSVIFPAMNFYFSTTWGFRGGNQFYANFFYPSLTLTPGFWGPYASRLPQYRALYTEATQPIVPGPNATTLATNWGRFVGVTSSGDPRFVYAARHPYNLTSDQWMSLSVPTSNASTLRSLVDNRSIWVGLRSVGARTTGWFDLGADFESTASASGNGVLDFAVLLGVPRNASTPLGYDPANVSTVTIELRQNLSGSGFTLGSAQATASNSSAIVPTWRSFLGGSRIDYLLVDRTIREGILEPLSYVDLVVQTLLAEHGLTPAFVGRDTQLYRLL